MKTLWEFRFESRGILFPEERQFAGEINPPDKPEIPFKLRITRDDEGKHLNATDAGKIEIVLPGRPEDTEDLARYLVDEVKEQISFPHGHIDIFGGLVTVTLLPENQAEETEVGDNRQFVKFRIKEVPRSMPEFDSTKFARSTFGSEHAQLLRQFNAAKQIEAPVEQFLGLFKILEKAYGSGSGGNLLAALRQNENVFQVACAVLRPKNRNQREITREDFKKTLVRLMRTRDNCAHLRRKTGYAAGDHRIQSDVEPYIGIVMKLAQECVARHLRPPDVR